MLYSVRMRAAQGGDHAKGGRHISGAECLVSAEGLAAVTKEMLERATTHSRGVADFINITVEAVVDEDIFRVELLPVRTIDVSDVDEGRDAAVAALVETGVDERAAKLGISTLAALPDSMRGAIILSAVSGERLDDRGERGVRVSRMDVDSRPSLETFLEGEGLRGVHVREALVLASKVAAAPGMVAELCWSDDPEYTAGYIASRTGYVRFPQLKEFGSPVGGRVFFVAGDCDKNELVRFLERQPVLVSVPEQGA